MKTLFLFLAFCFILIAAGCKTENPTTVVKPKIQDSIEVVTDTSSIDLGYCFPAALMPNENLVIYNEIQYRVFIQGKRPITKCDTASLPEIDFTKYTLLAKRLSNHIWAKNGQVQYPQYIKTIYKYNYLNKIRYHVTSIEAQDSSGVVDDSAPVELNLIKMPKVSENVVIEFDSTLIIQIR